MTDLNMSQLLKNMDSVHSMSGVNRKIYKDGDRQETDAEHTYGMLALFQLLRESLYREQHFDALKVYDLILIHDLPETVCGDVWYQDHQGQVGKKEREDKAAKQIFTPMQFKLWEDWETRTSIESILAKKLDVLQAVFSIVQSKGQTWKRNKITRQTELDFSMWIWKENDLIGNLLKDLFIYATTNKMFFDQIENIHID